MQERVAERLRRAVNNHDASYDTPMLKPIEIAIYHCLSNAGKWVLIERVPYNPRVQASPLYIALRRRGFQVSYRSENGVKNVWARWPHDEPHLAIAEFGPELDTGLFGEHDPNAPDAEDGSA